MYRYIYKYIYDALDSRSGFSISVLPGIDCTTFHSFFSWNVWKNCFFFNFQKLAGLWLLGEVDNHVAICGSKVAEGFSAFQRRSCVEWLRLSCFAWSQSKDTDIYWNLRASVYPFHLTHQMINYFKYTYIIRALSIISRHWDGTGGGKGSLRKASGHLSYKVYEVLWHCGEVRQHLCEILYSKSTFDVTFKKTAVRYFRRLQLYI